MTEVEQQLVKHHIRKTYCVYSAVIDLLPETRIFNQRFIISWIGILQFGTENDFRFRSEGFFFRRHRLIKAILIQNLFFPSLSNKLNHCRVRSLRGATVSNMVARFLFVSYPLFVCRSKLFGSLCFVCSSSGIVWSNPCMKVLWQTYNLNLFNPSNYFLYLFVQIKKLEQDFDYYFKFVQGVHCRCPTGYCRSNLIDPVHPNIHSY